MSYRKYARALARQGYEPIPLNGKRPIVANWARMKIDDEQIKKWVKQYPDRGVGIRNEGAVDFDVYNTDVSEGMRTWIESNLPGKVLIRYGLRPKFLIPARIAADVRNKLSSAAYTDTEGRINKIEIIGEGSQYVCYSIHPDTGEPYEWDGDELIRVAADNLPFVDLAFIQKLFDEFDRLCGETEGLEQTEAQSSLFNKKPPAYEGRTLDPTRPGDDFVLKTDFYELLINDGFQDTGKDEWAEEYEYGPRGEPIITKVPRQHLTRPGKEDGVSGSLTYYSNGVTIFRPFSTSIPGLEAFKGYTAFSYLVATQFNNNFKEAAKDLRSKGFGRTPAAEEFKHLTEQDLETHFLERFVYIADTNSVADLEIKGPDSILPLANWKRLYANVPSPTRATMPNYWEKHAKRLSANVSKYLPGEETLTRSTNGNYNIYNLYYGPEWEYTEDESLVKPIVDHINWLTGGSGAESSNLYMSYLSHLMHKPQERPTICPILISPAQGTGRGFIDGLIRKALGPWNCSTTTLDKLAKSNFDDHLIHKLYVSIAEVKEDKSRKYEIGNDIKEVLTAMSLHVNQKYGKQDYIQIYARIHMTSNIIACITIPEEDRRFFVIICMHQPKGPEYYTRLYELLDSPVAISQWISYTWRWHNTHAFNPFAAPPMTIHKQNLINAGTSPVEGGIREVVMGEDTPAVGLFPQIADAAYLKAMEYGVFTEDDPVDKANVRKQLTQVLSSRNVTHNTFSRLQIAAPGGKTVRGKLYILKDFEKWTTASKDELLIELAKWGAGQGEPQGGANKISVSNLRSVAQKYNIADGKKVVATA